jgi:hypothetical protein
MRWLTWFDTLNLIDVLTFYLILCFVVSAAIRARTYWAVLGMVLGCPKRWPKLLEVAKTHRGIFLCWPMLLTIGLAFAVMVSNALANWLVLAQAEVTFADLRGHWWPFAVVVLSGGLMLFLDCRAVFGGEQFDRPAVEKDMDRAESWLKSWVSPALRVVTFGFLNPRKVVGAEVHRLLVEANWSMIGGMRRASLRVVAQFAFGLSLWLTWAFALRASA